MAKIKHTKNELKAQKEALHRYERFLPMLQLKKQQLQVEIHSITVAIEEKEQEAEAINAGLQTWVQLLSEEVDLQDYIALQAVETHAGNIAGVAIPILNQVILQRATPDLFTTPTWLDDAIDVLGSLIELRVKIDILAEQKKRIEEELRITSQRVNLFEKVKIPECKENIRVIKIYLGDEQTAAVARGKIAKKRAPQEEAA
jgi:V/A-type H+-transporting ATPase subunit D